MRGLAYMKVELKQMQKTERTLTKEGSKQAENKMKECWKQIRY